MTTAQTGLVELEAEAAVRGKRKRWADVASMAKQLSAGRWIAASHLAYVSGILKRLAHDQLRLIVTCPPRSGKSELISHWLPVWYLARWPDKRIILTSYEASFAASWGRKVRNEIVEHSAELGISVSADSSAAAEWNLSGGYDGGMITAGVGGPITGRGANCVAEGTLIQTDRGLTPIEDLQLRPIPCNILSYGGKGIEYKKLEGIRAIEGARVLRVTTATGRVIEVTPDHLVYSQGQYVQAGKLSPGDSVLLLLRQAIPAGSLRGVQGNRETLCRPLLFSEMQRTAPRNQESETVHNLRCANGSKKPQVLRDMPTAQDGAQAYLPCPRCHLPDMQHSLPRQVERQERGEVCNVLQQTMRRTRSLAADGGAAQPQVEEWGYTSQAATAFSQGISFHAPKYSGERQLSMCGVRRGEAATCTSFGRLADEQRGLQSGNPVQQLPPIMARGQMFQTITDTVAVVERLHQTARVYDLQVEANHNFFANGILVHNCMIIDDPVKNAEEAASQVYRDKAWDWWLSTARTRLEPGGSVVVIMTRWHDDDLVGRMLKDDSEQWQLVTFPALAEPGDVLGRAEGQALWPERYSAPVLQQTRQTLGPYFWSALYQQHPVMGEGQVFHRDWWQYYDGQPECWEITQAWDTAAKTGDANDYSACITIGRHESGFAILDCWCQRVEFPELARQVETQYERWMPQRVIVEDAASGVSLIQTMHRSSPLPIIAVKPVGDKLTRARLITGMIEAGRVSLPRRAAWLTTFLEQTANFPTGAHDDIVDALVYAIGDMMQATAGNGDKPVELIRRSIWR